MFICLLSLERKKKQDRNTCICKIHPCCVCTGRYVTSWWTEELDVRLFKRKKKNSVQGFFLFLQETNLLLLWEQRGRRLRTGLQWRIGVHHACLCFGAGRGCAVCLWCGPIRLNFMTSSLWMLQLAHTPACEKWSLARYDSVSSELQQTALGL